MAEQPAVNVHLHAAPHNHLLHLHHHTSDPNSAAPHSYESSPLHAAPCNDRLPGDQSISCRPAAAPKTGNAHNPVMVVGGLVIGGTVIGGAEAGEGKRTVRKAHADGSRWLRGKTYEGKRVVPLSFRASMFLLFAGIMMVAVSFKSIPALNKGKIVPAGEIVNGNGGAQHALFSSRNLRGGHAGIFIAGSGDDLGLDEDPPPPHTAGIAESANDRRRVTRVTASSQFGTELGYLFGSESGSGFQSVEKALSEGQGVEGRGVKGRSGDGDGFLRKGEVNGLSRREIVDGVLKKRSMKAEGRGGLGEEGRERGGAGSGDSEGEDEYKGGESEGDGAGEETREGRRESARGGVGGSGGIRRTNEKEEEEEEAEGVRKIRRVGASGDGSLGEDEETEEHREELKHGEEERRGVGAERKREDDEDVEGGEGEGEGEGGGDYRGKRSRIAGVAVEGGKVDEEHEEHEEQRDEEGKGMGGRDRGSGGSEEQEGRLVIGSKEEGTGGWVGSRDGEGNHGRREEEEDSEQRAAGEEHEDGAREHEEGTKEHEEGTKEHEEGTKEHGHRGMEDQEYGDEERGGHEQHTGEGRHEDANEESRSTFFSSSSLTSSLVAPLSPLSDYSHSSSSVPLPPFGFNASLSHAPPVPFKENFLWRAPKSQKYAQCIARSRTHKVPVKGSTNGYLLVTANGGLNQMRAAICDMVAVARIMNVTLVVPELDHTSFWADPSEFEDIFDLDHFISSLKKDIRIVRQLPKRVAHIEPLEKFPVSWSPFSYYREDLLPRVKKHRVMRFPLTDSRLANNGVPDSIQRLRCRANYKSLRYTPSISQIAANLISRLHARGPYIALHLRYEKDMLAFTGCDHGLQASEREELKAMRLNNSRWKEKEIDGEARRTEGACPLTPRETALFLRAMGYPNKTLIYVAAGDIYGSNGLEDLTRLYPNTYTHSTLATAEELASLGAYQNRLAAVDYTVAVQSDVFVYTYEGNMARAVQGHRRFEGHRKTVIPNREAIIRHIDQLKSRQIRWKAFRRLIRQAHKEGMGAPHLREVGENPKLEENFYANPFPGCICEVERQADGAVRMCRRVSGQKRSPSAVTMTSSEADERSGSDTPSSLAANQSSASVPKGLSYFTVNERTPPSSPARDGKTSTGKNGEGGNGHRRGWGSIKPYVLSVSLLASISSGLLGYDIGVTSGALIFVAEDFDLSHVQQEIFVGILNIVSLVGALSAGRLADFAGRRFAMGAAASIFIAGALCMALAPTYAILVTGRVVTGVGVGFGLALPPLFISEISPPGQRGGLVSFGELFINIGIVVGFLTSFLLSGLPVDSAWRWMLGLGAVPGFILAVGVVFLPESPRWLIMHGQVKKAKDILLTISDSKQEAHERMLEILEAAGLKEEVISKGPAAGSEFSPARGRSNSRERLEGSGGEGGEGTVYVDEEEQEIHVIRAMEGAGGQGVWKELLWPTPAVGRMLVVCVGTNFLQQAVGIDAAVYYSPVVLRDAGVTSTRALLGATLLMGVIKVSFVGIATCMLDHFGRRPLLLASTAGMTIALLTQALAFLKLPTAVDVDVSTTVTATTGVPAAAIVAFTGLCFYVAFFSIGIGPINWLYTSEIFPLRLRAQATGIGTAVNRIASGVVAMTFLSLADATGSPAGPFFMFAGMGVVAFVFFYFLAPETRGKSLEQIVRMFEKGTYAWVQEAPEEIPSVGLAVYDGNKMQQGWGETDSSPSRTPRDRFWSVNRAVAAMRKKVDARIRTLVENGVKSRQRSMFVIVGDKGREQVVNLHYMLSKAVVKARPNVLWCYKNDLFLSSNRKKRMRQMKKMMQRGLLDPEKEDPFALFMASTAIRYCYYAETHKILGNTFGMCVLQDFEALTPNLLARTIETVEGGGIIVLLLSSLTSLSHLFALAMDVHARYRTESHGDVVGRFNERFILSLASCPTCCVMDDELNILPLSSHMRLLQPSALTESNRPARAPNPSRILPMPLYVSPGRGSGIRIGPRVEGAQGVASRHPAGGGAGGNVSHAGPGQSRGAMRHEPMPFPPFHPPPTPFPRPSAGRGSGVRVWQGVERTQGVASRHTAGGGAGGNVSHAGPGQGNRELKELKESLADTQPVGALVATCRTLDQAKAVVTFLDAVSEKTLRSTVAITAARGRGKSAALGVAVAGAVALGYSNIFVTAPSPENLKTLFEFVFKGFDAIGYKEHIDYELVESTNPAFNRAIVRVNVFHQHRQTIQYVMPQHAERVQQAELLVIDEAAAIPLPMVKALLGPYLVFMGSTVNGYEGTGRSLSLKLIQQLREQSKGAAAAGAAGAAATADGAGGSGGGGGVSVRVLREVELQEPIRYADGDPVEKWLNHLLCLDATSHVPKLQARMPHPDECELFYVNRDTLFSFHSASELFLQRMMALYVSSHYKNTPNDLQLMSDAPAHHLFVLLGPVDESQTSLPDVLCVLQVCLEGEISRASALKGLSQGHQPTGDLLPWTLSQQFQDSEFPSLSGARVVRIAVHPDLMHAGYGSRAVDLLARYYEGQLTSMGEDSEEESEEEEEGGKRHSKAVQEARVNGSASLLEEQLAPRSGLPPLLQPVGERRQEQLHYVGVSFGLGQQLFNFWRRQQFVPLYVRQTPSDITGEHTCIMLKPLRNDDLGPADSKDSWLGSFSQDFHRRFLSLLGFSFRPLPPALCLRLLKKSLHCTLVVLFSIEFAEAEAREAVVPAGLMEGKAALLSPYDMKRLESYANNLVDYHLIMDLIPPLARLYFLGLIPASLSYAQAAILLSFGLQHHELSTIEANLRLPGTQVLALFNKAIRKIHSVLYAAAARTIEAALPRIKEVQLCCCTPQPQVLALFNKAIRKIHSVLYAAAARTIEAALPRIKEVDLRPHPQSVDEDLAEAADQAKKVIKSRLEGAAEPGTATLLTSLTPGQMQEFAIDGRDQDFEAAIAAGGGKLPGSGVLSIKAQGGGKKRGGGGDGNSDVAEGGKKRMKGGAKGKGKGKGGRG
ncbi:unnamed protein product [Closterium sp. NIES-53]